MRPPESFIGQPIRALQTMLRTIAEDHPDYQTVIPDGIYGPETRSAVMLFQRNQGLPPTGITDQNTWERIVSEYELALISQTEAWPLYPLLDPGQILRNGEQHPHIFLLQAVLAVLAEAYPGLTAPSHSGILDGPTQQALEGFQILSRLPPNGQLDKRTWKHLALHYPLAASTLMSQDISSDR